MNATANPPEAAAAHGQSAKTARAPKAAAGTGPEVAAAPARPPVELSDSKLELFEQRCNSWVVIAPVGTKPEDLHMRPEPFAQIAWKLNRGDNVRAILGDDSAMIDMICVASTGSSALCFVTHFMPVPNLYAEAEVLPDGYVIRRARPDELDGSPEGWLVVRLRPDGSEEVTLNAGSPLLRREDARRYLLDHAAVRGNTPRGLYRGPVG